MTNAATSGLNPRWYGSRPGHDLHRTDHDFQAIGPALRILQLNVEGLSAAKQSVISSIADREKIDIIFLQETHVDGNIAAASPSLVSTCELYVACQIRKSHLCTWKHHQSTSSSHPIDSILWCHSCRRLPCHQCLQAPSERWDSTNVLPVLPIPCRVSWRLQ